MQLSTHAESTPLCSHKVNTQPDTDTFSLQKVSDANDAVVESTIEISTSNLVYGNLKGNKFKVTDATKNKQWIDVQSGKLLIKQNGSLSG